MKYTSIYLSTFINILPSYTSRGALLWITCCELVKLPHAGIEHLSGGCEAGELPTFDVLWFCSEVRITHSHVLSRHYVSRPS